MPRIARVVVSGVPHHATQRGNRGQDVFFTREDRERYLAWLVEYAARHRLKIWAYCLMSNHVHFVAVPKKAPALAKVLRSLHMRHAQRVNAEQDWRGHLWQGRFFSCPLDEAHLAAAVRYVERNPVRAGLVRRAEKYPWSSAAAHCALREDEVLSPDLPLVEWIEDWSAWLRMKEPKETLERLRRLTLKGLPCGDKAFVKRIERRTGRKLSDRQQGRPSKGKEKP